MKDATIDATCENPLADVLTTMRLFRAPDADSPASLTATPPSSDLKPGPAPDHPSAVQRLRATDHQEVDAQVEPGSHSSSTVRSDRAQSKCSISSKSQYLHHGTGSRRNRMTSYGSCSSNIESRSADVISRPSTPNRSLNRST